MKATLDTGKESVDAVTTSFDVEDGKRYVTAVAVAQDDRFSRSVYARITDAKLREIRNIINERTPYAPDLIPLQVSASSDVTAGEQLESTSFKILNYSKSLWNGEIDTSFYLSTDDNIDQSDILIWNGITVGATGIGPKSTVSSIGPNLIIPNWIPTGDYYLGIILGVNDSDMSNNITKLQDIKLIHVAGLPPATWISDLYVSDGMYDDKIRIMWDPVEGATYYKVYSSEFSSKGPFTMISDQ
jgi:hypothetical protein